MSEVLEIEIDGEIDDGISEGFESERRSPQWGLPAAIAVAGVLLLAVLVVVVMPAITNPWERQQPPMPAKTAAPPKAAAPVESAQGALAAWGRFAVSGDLKQLDGWLVPDGPQYRSLAREAAELAARPPAPPAYEVRLTDPTVMSVTGTRATLRGDVTWTRGGEVDQRYQWEIVLRRAPRGRWLLWTVTDAK
ncbi:MAG TPA: hypothetical protein VM142_11160 [Acidimicrobiales bacterium]|nr:hypothetical protein [Acidimicrobiales bacterium]